MVFLQPLSAVITKGDLRPLDEEHGLPIHDNDNSQSLPPPSPSSRPHRLSLFSTNLIPKFRRRPKAVDEGTLLEMEKPPDLIDVRVAVMVAMPCNPAGDCSEKKAEYEFGIAEVQCLPGTMPA